MARVFIGIGANEGDRLAQISRAIEALAQEPGVRVVQIAMIAETEPVGGPPQERYLNTALELDTDLPPRALLEVLQRIERRLGRVPNAVQWGPRPIDLDLLLYADRIIADPDLIVPHPRLHTRLFVLEPLAQLAPKSVHPVLRQTMVQLRDALSGFDVGADCSFLRDDDVLSRRIRDVRLANGG